MPLHTKHQGDDGAERVSSMEEVVDEKEESWYHSLEALEHPYRRQLLVTMLEQNPQDDDDVDPLDSVDYSAADAEQLQIALRHVHLPKLEQRGFITWDRRRGAISKGPDWDEIAPLLTLIHDHSDELPAGWL